ncbi:putative ATP/GTP binding protein [Helicobacter cinaedi PAGU611]|uniref:hypothetical protein n=1 Tax=Helicobacter cinaedi TaxID=213 RepID=UPI00025D358E|nr:hypothetical protein [Helicobacter cinaedi]BAM12494.1 putative ATP/GTP binding protein [Helicobacter cinaedi PAGU611]
MFWTLFLIYLADISDFIKSVAGWGAIVFGILTIGGFGNASEGKGSWVMAFICLPLAVLLTSVWFFMPSKNFFYIAAGIYTGNEMLTNEKASNILDKSYKLLDTKLDELLERQEAKKKD